MSQQKDEPTTVVVMEVLSTEEGGSTRASSHESDHLSSSNTSSTEDTFPQNFSTSRWPQCFHNLWNKLDPSIQSQLAKAKYPKWPIVTSIILFFVWVSYIYGITTLSISPSTPSSSGSVWALESPPQEVLVFRSVNQWPQCTDARPKVWRIFSFQLVHLGIIHIVGNTVFGFVNGLFLENLHSFDWIYTGISYLGGVITGSMGFNYVWPYASLIGCSCGMYSIQGTTLGLLLINRDDKINYPVKSACIFIIVGTTMAIEFILYFVNYDPSVAYASHACGVIFGLLWGLSAGIIKRNCRWKQITGYTSAILLMVFVGLVIGFYSRPWPPVAPKWNPTFERGYDPMSLCCAQLNNLIRLNPGVSRQVLIREVNCVS